MPRESRTEPRYFAITPIPAEIDGNNADLVDISTTGARVQTIHNLSAGQEVRFMLRMADATVVWSGTAERKGRFESGLSISDAEAWLRCVIDELALRDGVVIETDSLRRKFDPFAVKRISGVVPIHR